MVLQSSSFTGLKNKQFPTLVYPVTLDNLFHKCACLPCHIKKIRIRTVFFGLVLSIGGTQGTICPSESVGLPPPGPMRSAPETVLSVVSVFLDKWQTSRWKLCCNKKKGERLGGWDQEAVPVSSGVLPREWMQPSRSMDIHVTCSVFHVPWVSVFHVECNASGHHGYCTSVLQHISAFNLTLSLSLYAIPLLLV